jgi:hypothetical protein
MEGRKSRYLTYRTQNSQELYLVQAFGSKSSFQRIHRCCRNLPHTLRKAKMLVMAVLVDATGVTWVLLVTVTVTGAVGS